MKHFASLAGMRGLFPSLSVEFLRDVFDARTQSTRLVKVQGVLVFDDTSQEKAWTD